MTIALDRVLAADVPLPTVSLVGATCPRCRMSVLVVRVGNDRMPVLLDVSSVTVVADSGRVMIGHPLHDLGACEVRVATNYREQRVRDDRIAERLSP